MHCINNNCFFQDLFKAGLNAESTAEVVFHFVSLTKGRTNEVNLYISLTLVMTGSSDSHSENSKQDHCTPIFSKPAVLC